MATSQSSSCTLIGIIFMFSMKLTFKMIVLPYCEVFLKLHAVWLVN